MDSAQLAERGACVKADERTVHDILRVRGRSAESPLIIALLSTKDTANERVCS